MRKSSHLVFAVASATAMVAGECVSECCKKLSLDPNLEGKVYFPGTDSYQDRLQLYWSASAALHPWCMVMPTSAEDVSAVVKTLVAGDCPFGVKGGGHGAHELANGVKEGVTVDFGLMNDTTWDPETRIASVQPGGHWQNVYDYLAQYGVLVAGGRAGIVGTGGFVSGGGNSFYSASHGMACDTVANFEVVLADGSIVNANKSSHADLFQALKGSSGNLGLITRFDMYPIEYADPENPVVWGGNLIYNPESAPAVYDALVEFIDDQHKDENSSSIVFWAYMPQILGETVLLNAAIENTLATVKPAAFDGYYAVDGILQDTTKVDTLTNVANDLGSGQPNGYHNDWFTLSFKNDARPIAYASDRFFELNLALEKVAPSSETGLNTLCMFQPITKSMVEKGVENGGNVMGLESYVEQGNGIMFLVTFGANSAEVEEQSLPLVQAYLDDVTSYVESLDLMWDWKYLNYAYKTQDPIATFGEDAISKLQAASAKYDHEGVFQKLRASGFKIPQ